MGCDPSGKLVAAQEHQYRHVYVQVDDNSAWWRMHKCAYASHFQSVG